MSSSAGSRPYSHSIAGLVAGAVVLLGGAAALQPAPARAEEGKVTFSIVSRQGEKAGGAVADGVSDTPAISGNGRFIAFQSKARNLSAIARPRTLNIYRYDTRMHRLLLVSKSAKGRPLNDKSVAPVVSRTGRYVAFSSQATNLPGGARFKGVYVYDAKRDRTRLVSRQSRADGGEAANAPAVLGDISADGSLISFQTYADNLGGPTVAGYNTYLYNSDRKRVELVSRQSDSLGGLGADGRSYGIGLMSGDGRYVTFDNTGSNLAGKFKPIFAPYIRDRLLGQTRSLAPSPFTPESDGYAYTGSISNDGRVATIFANADNPDGSRVCCGFLLSTRTNETLLRNRYGELMVSGDGDYVFAPEDAGGRFTRTELETGATVDVTAGIPTPPEGEGGVYIDPSYYGYSDDGSRAVFTVSPRRGRDREYIYLARIEK